MICSLCGSVVIGIYCGCGEKMRIPELKNSTIELKNNDVRWEGDPAYMRHLEPGVKDANKNWIAEAIKKTVHLPKKEKAQFWRENMKLALNGELPC
jgi:hypothetical protein